MIYSSTVLFLTYSTIKKMSCCYCDMALGRIEFLDLSYFIINYCGKEEGEWRGEVEKFIKQ